MVVVGADRSDLLLQPIGLSVMEINTVVCIATWLFKKKQDHSMALVSEEQSSHFVIAVLRDLTRAMNPVPLLHGEGLVSCLPV